METMAATLCFLVEKQNGVVSRVCLGMKKQGIGKGYWNGIGGKVGDNHPQETIEEATVRETKEEIRVEVKNLTKVAELEFLFPKEKKDWNQFVHVFLAEDWAGEPKETPEMMPAWFNPQSIPWGEMWEDARYWLPHVLEGKKMRATFWYDNQPQVVSFSLYFVKGF